MLIDAINFLIPERNRIIKFFGIMSLLILFVLETNSKHTQDVAKPTTDYRKTRTNECIVPSQKRSVYSCGGIFNGPGNKRIFYLINEQLQRFCMIYETC